MDASSVGGGSVDEGRHGQHRHLSPTMEEGNGYCQSDDQYRYFNFFVKFFLHSQNSFSSIIQKSILKCLLKSAASTSLTFLFPFSLSNISSSGFSNKSSLNDSGVVGDQELDSVSEDKLRLHVSYFKVGD